MRFLLRYVCLNGSLCLGKRDQVCVACRPAYTVASPFAVMPSNATGATYCEQISAILTLGQMAVLCDGQPEEITQAVADSVQSDLSMVCIFLCGYWGGCDVLLLAGEHAMVCVCFADNDSSIGTWYHLSIDHFCHRLRRVTTPSR